jgi:hypothetical protein
VWRWRFPPHSIRSQLMGSQSMECGSAVAESGTNADVSRAEGPIPNAACGENTGMSRWPSRNPASPEQKCTKAYSDRIRMSEFSLSCFQFSNPGSAILSQLKPSRHPAESRTDKTRILSRSDVRRPEIERLRNKRRPPFTGFRSRTTPHGPQQARIGKLQPHPA